MLTIALHLMRVLFDSLAGPRLPSTLRFGEGRANNQMGQNILRLRSPGPPPFRTPKAMRHEINKRLRSQESTFPKSKKESKAEFLRRLRRVALSFSPRLVGRVVRSMKRRCKAIKANGGYLIDE